MFANFTLRCNVCIVVSDDNDGSTQLVKHQPALIYLDLAKKLTIHRSFGLTVGLRLDGTTGQDQPYQLDVLGTKPVAHSSYSPDRDREDERKSIPNFVYISVYSHVQREIDTGWISARSKMGIHITY